jgi:hypothetical protein
VFDGLDSIQKVNLDGTGLTQFANRGMEPTWCANGQLAFIGQSGIDTIDANGGNLTHVLVEANPQNPAWSPDCKYIFYRHYSYDPSIPGGDSTDIYVVPATGGEPVQLTNSGRAGEPSVSNDWTLAYFQWQSGGLAHSEIYVQWLGDTQSTVLPSELPLSDDREPSFQPGDGSIPAPAGFPIHVSQAPIIDQLAINAPKATDAPLTRGLTITPGAGAIPGTSYEYAWGKQWDIEPSTPLQTSLVPRARLSYRDASPNADWVLFARGIATDGNRGPWATLPVRTPPAPILVALGDSITAGHHLAGTDKHPVCYDSDYSYASDAWLAFELKLPRAWRKGVGSYFNYAHSGFGTDKVLAGGKDACGDRWPRDAILPEAAQNLRSHANSWNQVVITAGVDDTNWAAFGGPLSVIFSYSLNVFPSRAKCDSLIRQNWNGYNSSIGLQISDNARAIVARLRGADQSARIHWLDYYNIAGTFLLLPSSCHYGINNALTRLHDVAARSLPGNIDWVDTDPALGGRGDLLQPFNPLKDPFHHFFVIGWPHPLSPFGTSALAEAIHF